MARRENIAGLPFPLICSGWWTRAYQERKRDIGRHGPARNNKAATICRRFFRSYQLVILYSATGCCTSLLCIQAVLQLPPIRRLPAPVPRAPYVTACNRQRAFSIEELDVFQCLSNDMTIEEEADHLDISASTVKARLKTARDRYGVKTNTWLVANALRANLIS
ncbi:hypothetical protein [Roseovarius aestuarii]|uniref:hypothetical protein n=1 Tax=Roseovarius aestuarii TaxID=475083 RepID=UPI00159315A9|nr:hypothetical protein [Roseovarius aestuarii]